LEEALPIAERMLSALRHRGPDGEGIQVIADPLERSPPLVWVHTRLAILDLSPAGRQPMSHAPAGSAPVWITFNGEIYNYRELAKELTDEGLVPQTGTDTEVILLAYRRWGIGALERLRGMFAWALADVHQRQVMLVRDRLGIKPLYLYRPQGGGLLFASEVRALLAAGRSVVPRRWDPAAVESFLAQGAVYGAAAHVQGVTLLEPASYRVLDWEGREQQRRHYWTFPPCHDPKTVVPREVAVTELGEELRTAVRQHLIADVPVGVFLSSGIDSTAIATLASEVSASQIRTVSVGFDVPALDETAQAEATARQLGTEHHTIRVRAEDVQADWSAVLAAMDQPTVDGFNTFYVSRAARQVGLTVSLSGLGGDELFGGYASFRDVPRAWRWGRWSRWLQRWAGYLRRWGQHWHQRFLVKWAEVPFRQDRPVAIYLLRRELFLPAERRALCPLPAACDPQTGLRAESWDLPANLDAENAVSWLELTGYMRHMLLRDADVFSMAHGLELRVPLLDHQVVSYVWRLPGAWKQPGKTSKALLVEAVGPRWPIPRHNRGKRGFTFPWSEWLQGPLADAAQQRLRERRLWQCLGFHPHVPAQLWHRFSQGDPAVTALQILALLVLAELTERQQLSL
jgi:asparagine synthase (glutamine-hydrolysing)